MDPMFDVANHLGATTRAIEDSTHEGTPVKVVVASRTYPTDADDLWQAITDPERIPRWFAPVSGELRLGGRFQIEGNAGQTPRRLTTILNAHLTYGAIDDVFALGMQEYLSDFLSDIGAIGQSIHAAYLEVL